MIKFLRNFYISLLAIGLIISLVHCSGKKAKKKQDECTPEETTMCVDKKAYWVDSCDTQGELKEECDCACNADETACLECGANGICDPELESCVCNEGFHDCSGECLSNINPDSCGTNCQPCPSDPNGIAGCNSEGNCTMTCNQNYALYPGGIECRPLYPCQKDLTCSELFRNCIAENGFVSCTSCLPGFIENKNNNCVATNMNIATQNPWGPNGGPVSRIVVDPTNPDNLWAVIRGIYIFFSSDQGQNWNAIDFPGGMVFGIDVMPDGRVFVGEFDEIYFSEDNGQTWHLRRDNIENDYGYGVQGNGFAYQDGNPGRVWAVMQHYGMHPIYYLEDGSTTWQPWNPPPNWDTDPIRGVGYPTDISTHYDTASGETFIFASYSEAYGIGGGIFCSTDSGVSFAKCNNGLKDTRYSQVEIYDDMVVTSGGSTYEGREAGLYYSTDQGQNWIVSNTGWYRPVGNGFTRIESGEFFVATYAQGIIRSNDLTQPWQIIPKFAGMEVYTVRLDLNQRLLAGPEQMGIFMSSDEGENWSALSNGFCRVRVTNACLDPSDANVWLASVNSLNTGSVYHSNSGPEGWDVLPSLAHPQYNWLSINQNGTWYVGADGPFIHAKAGLWISKDQGQSFEFKGPIYSSGPTLKVVGIVERVPDEHLIVGGHYWWYQEQFFDSFIMETIDGGLTWQELWRGHQDMHFAKRLVDTESQDVFLAVHRSNIIHLKPDKQIELINVPHFINGDILDVAACAFDSELIYAVGRTGQDSIYAINNLARSVDQGYSWDLIDFERSTKREQPIGVVMHPFDCKVLFMSTSTRLLHSQDEGKSWQELDITGLHRITRLRLIPMVNTKEMTLLVIGDGGIIAFLITTDIQE